jgi:hypothetical protein
MKKVLFILIILLIFSTITFAGTYEIKDINLSISFDDSWIIFTRDNIVGNENLKTLGIQEGDLQKMLIDNNIYLDAASIDNDKYIEILVGYVSSEKIFSEAGKQNFNDLKDLNKKEIDEFARGVMESRNINKDGNYEIYENANAKYILLEYTLEDSTKEYVTVVNGSLYSVQILSNYDAETNSNINIQNIIDSIVFTRLAKQKAKGFPVVQIFLILSALVVIIFFIRKNIKKVKRNLDDTHAGYRILK